jgi:hypothetical protein
LGVFAVCGVGEADGKNSVTPTPTNSGKSVTQRNIVDGRNALDAGRWREAGWTTAPSDDGSPGRPYTRGDVLSRYVRGRRR